MSLDSMSSAATKELENDQLRLEKKNLEDEIGRIGKHLEEIRRESSLVSSCPPVLDNPTKSCIQHFVPQLTQTGAKKCLHS